MSKMFEFVKNGYLHNLLWKYDTKPVITENGTDIDVSGLDTIGVNVPNPSTGKLNITSTAEVNVTNYAAAQVVDANLVAGNIKKDVPILGVTGSYEAPASDFSTAEVTVVTAEGALNVPIVSTNPLDSSDCSKGEFMNEAATYTVILYKGKLFASLEDLESFYIEKVSGAIEIIDVEGLTGVAAVITGDCSINLKNRQG